MTVTGPNEQSYTSQVGAGLDRVGGDLLQGGHGRPEGIDGGLALFIHFAGPACMTPPLTRVTRPCSSFSPPRSSDRARRRMNPHFLLPYSLPPVEARESIDEGGWTRLTRDPAPRSTTRLRTRLRRRLHQVREERWGLLLYERNEGEAGGKGGGFARGGARADGKGVEVWFLAVERHAAAESNLLPVSSAAPLAPQQVLFLFLSFASPCYAQKSSRRVGRA